MNYFNFLAFEQVYKVLNREFLIWFIGFSEGDGSWIVRTKRNRVMFQIGQKEEHILLLIRHMLGFGIVRSYNAKTRVNKLNRTYYQYVVEKKQHILFLIALFNGNLILDKTQNRFNQWVCSYAKFYDYPITVKTNKIKVDLKSPWLCGFTDAEGCFRVTLTKPTLKRKSEVQRVFCLSQTEKAIVVSIRDLILKQRGIQSKHSNYLISENKSYEISTFQVTITDKNQLFVLIDYFNQYPLKTNKKKTFERWVYFVVEKNLINRYDSQNALLYLTNLVLAIQNHDLPFEPLNLKK
jgi:hypothetical protein